MRATFRWLTAIVFALVVVQVGLAAFGAFDAVHKSESAAIGKKTTEDAFGAHAILGSLIVLLMVVLLIVAAIGSLGDAKVKWAGAIVGLGIVQYLLGVVSTSAPALGFLHGVNALAIFVATGMLSHRTWKAERTAPSDTAPVRSPA
ncbi:MAG TPA: DUF6220 domain-containing protein [Solirubrobacteraceae bacterium]|nr:DUF6220 domain-containing protein [Solirubrobacteraceae bacterium]